MTDKEAIDIIRSECYIFSMSDMDRMTIVNTALDRAIKALKFHDYRAEFEELMHVETTTKKPPLGIMSRCLFYENRAKDILKAMQRYNETNSTIPSIWIIELEDLIQKICEMRCNYNE